MAADPTPRRATRRLRSRVNALIRASHHAGSLTHSAVRDRLLKPGQFVCRVIATDRPAGTAPKYLVATGTPSGFGELAVAAQAAFKYEREAQVFTLDPERVSVPLAGAAAPAAAAAASSWASTEIKPETYRAALLAFDEVAAARHLIKVTMVLSGIHRMLRAPPTARAACDALWELAQDSRNLVGLNDGAKPLLAALAARIAPPDSEDPRTVLSAIRAAWLLSERHGMAEQEMVVRHFLQNRLVNVLSCVRVRRHLGLVSETTAIVPETAADATALVRFSVVVQFLVPLPLARLADPSQDNLVGHATGFLVLSISAPARLLAVATFQKERSDAAAGAAGVLSAIRSLRKDKTKHLRCLLDLACHKDDPFVARVAAEGLLRALCSSAEALREFCADGEYLLMRCASRISLPRVQGFELEPPPPP